MDLVGRVYNSISVTTPQLEVVKTSFGGVARNIVEPWGGAPFAQRKYSS